MSIHTNSPRRKFLKGVAASAVLCGFPLRAEEGFSAPAPMPRRKTGTLSGTEFHLTLERTVVNISGSEVVATTINGMMPGPTLKWREGEVVTIHVTNHMPVSSSIHWHGIILPFEMDGVPGISYKGISPGETFTYRFAVRQSGTYWYHSHTGFQEQTGMHGTLIIEPKDADPIRSDRDYVVALSDWSDEKPDAIYRKLKLHSDYYNFSRRTLGDLLSEVKEFGFFEAVKDRGMWNRMRMSDRDLSDVTAHTYTYLLNGCTDAEDWHALFRPGEKVRLRFVNQAAMTIFDVRIPGLKLTVVAADGNPVEPVEVDEFRIAVAETYDVVVEPDEKAYCIFAQSIERAGCVGATLAPERGRRVARPAIDPLEPLTMADMGMADMGMADMGMTDMDGGGMKCGGGMEMSAPHPKAAVPAWPITPLPMAQGVGTTMKAPAPRYRLDDPGVGLRNNGRRVLTYADLKNYHSTAAAPEPDREIVLHLTGNMERYMWSINGIKYADADALKFYYGERLRVTFVNDTMMIHPMHLHGMWSDLETGDDDRLVRKHTVMVQPGSKISYRVSVDAKGSWAYHCHMLYHMMGMFRKVKVVS